MAILRGDIAPPAPACYPWGLNIMRAPLLHHLSIAARNPKKAAGVLAHLMGGKAVRQGAGSRGGRGHWSRSPRALARSLFLLVEAGQRQRAGLAPALRGVMDERFLAAMRHPDLGRADIV